MIWPDIRRVGLAAVGAATVALLVGCSQFAELQPVAGDEITSVKIATNDVLVDKQVDVLVWPVCSFADEAYTCQGTEVGGAAITSSVPVQEPLLLKVSVDGKVLFQGPLKPVITEAARTP